MYLVDFFNRMPIGRQIRLDGLVHDGDKSDNVTKRNKRRRLHSIDFVLLNGRMPQCNLLLVVEPVLIVGPQARIQNPLLKAEIAGRQVFGDGVSLGRARMPGEVRNAGDNATAPVVNDLLCLVREHLTGEPRIALGVASSVVRLEDVRLGSFSSELMNIKSCTTTSGIGGGVMWASIASSVEGSAATVSVDVRAVQPSNTSDCGFCNCFHTASADSSIRFSVTSSRDTAISMSSPSSDP